MASDNACCTKTIETANVTFQLTLYSCYDKILTVTELVLNNSASS